MIDLKKKLEQKNIQQFQEDLISWYEKEKRDLPWRSDTDPYKIWVSEVMLQQTRVETVIPYFNNFIDKFPNIKALAEADEEKVLKAWEGLGYYSRVRNLQSAVKEVHERYGGVVPSSKEEFGGLKGVGPYTRGAVLSIAYNQPVPAVDGNVMRVMSRILSVWDDIAKPKTKTLFENIVEAFMSKDKPSEFNQGLMELGAVICTPKSPSCLLCPVREHCSAFAEGCEKELPVKSKKKKPGLKSLAAVVLTDEEGYFYIHKRPESGLLANLWEFPNTETQKGLKTEREQLSAFLKEQAGIEADIGPLEGIVEHVFTHLVWNISVFFGKVLNQPDGTYLKRVTKEELAEYAFPVSHQKIWNMYMK
ncbi:A/G-specific adenine glycosylase [Bacillus sonorensis]|uniref:A/G-specific adenine glycosylase n=1 Tax=Bacillus sonorensis TaxID=119858 RepID=UPI000497420C|nr:A/G-specific adenine glycosylase [Bacillus sonorensis]MCY8036433.1 A/G-specific adenine glycosylase [Bacillus sonorensis]MCY8561813.1 A/G-specific adenine glycosylase [Bacillus sonorensis]MCZ0070874.1 A/G-specific adenine glycosylase [Bacillus sonorensis]MCZ0098461.1 A/G-specific adenine glycosylase [Bacillus sonorensis]MEC1519847.1 A/G-specific adenine glycosylase [Bacillus sonorensis]